MSWNGDEYLRNDVHQIRLVAENSRERIPTADAIVETSLSKGSINTNLRPSTKYLIYIEELSNPSKIRIIHYITTSKGGNIAYRL